MHMTLTSISLQLFRIYGQNPLFGNGQLSNMKYWKMQRMDVYESP